MKYNINNALDKNDYSGLCNYLQTPRKEGSIVVLETHYWDIKHPLMEKYNKAHENDEVLSGSPISKELREKLIKMGLLK